MRRIAIAGVLAILSVFAFPPGAHAVGELAPAGCIDDNDTGIDACAQAINGLAQGELGSVAVSPDGASVYVAASGDNALVRFNRSPSGALTPAGCIDDNDTGEDACAQSVNGLDEATSVAVSPDGASVYVASAGDDAIVGFNRSSSGALTPAGCVDDNDTGADACAQSVNGLGNALSVAVSPDGASVYVASVSDDAIVGFNRSSSGALTPAGCVDDNDTGEDACAQSVNGLGNALSVALSPDGASVYVASAGDSALVRFNRSASGALTPAGCIDDNDTGFDACAQSINGLNIAASVAVSPDGASVYAASVGDDALVRFNRSASGALTPAGCIDDNDTGADACAQSVNGLAGAVSVAVSPDGASVYVATVIDNAIVGFNRSPAGALTPAGCVDDNDEAADDCAQSVNGLGFANAVSVSPDGASVYAVGAADAALVRFNRQT